MSLDPAERLAALRREVEGERPAPQPPPPPPPRVVSGIVEPVGSERAQGGSGPRQATSGPGERASGAGIRGTAPDAGGGVAWSFGSGDLRRWFGLGLVVVGGYLVLAQAVPGVALLGSFAMLGAGLLLLTLNFSHRRSDWALYVGALLAPIGAANTLVALFPISGRGLAAIGVGLAFLAIAWRRQRVGGGSGWQTRVGIAAVALGALQFAVGLLPGSPSLLDVLVPLLLIVLGVMLVGRLVTPARE